MSGTATGPARPTLDRLHSIHEDGSRNKLHPADVRGRYQRRKHLIWTLLIAIYVALPWVRIGGHPAILIDIEHRSFYLFGNTFNAQDFWLAFFFVTGLGFALFVVSALWGRLWCGYACPHTVFLEGVYRKIERWLEGPPRQRRDLDRSPWTGRKVALRGAKYGIYLAISLVLSHTFLSYFISVDTVFAAVTGSPAQHPTAFAFVLAFTAIIFVNFTSFREQLCIILCPYGRLQGALYDPHTVNVGYDRARGEPRGPRGAEGAGDCVDCFRCVAVCPTGIDIRNGTQLECVGCANCIDACDDVMQKLGRPAGLVRYDTQARFEGGARRFFRPRVALYGVLLLIGLAVFTVAASGRSPFEAKLLRAQASPYTIDGDQVTNPFSLHLINKMPEAVVFSLEAVVPDGFTCILPLHTVPLDSLADTRVPIFVRFPRAGYHRGQQIEVRVIGNGVEQKAAMPLLGPGGGS